MMCCFYTKISIINTVIQNRAKLQFSQQNGNILILPFVNKNYLLFPAPMPRQAIVNLNYLQHSVALAATIFAHLELFVSVFDM